MRYNDESLNNRLRERGQKPKADILFIVVVIKVVFKGILHYFRILHRYYSTSGQSCDFEIKRQVETMR